MTTIDTSAPVAGAGTGVGRLLAEIAAWITTSDHKRLGRLMIGVSLLVALAAAVVALLLGIERLDSADYAFLSQSSEAALVTAMQIGLGLGAAAPLLLGVAVAVVPLQLGARSLAMPRAAALGFWTWLVGLGLVIWSLIGGGGPGGADAQLTDLYLAALALIAAGLVLVAGSLVVTVLTNRAPGMTLERAPSLAWGALVGGVATVVSLPVLFGNAIYLFVDSRNAQVAFGGADQIDVWTRWMVSQPQTLVYVIIALGAAADIIVTVSRGRHPLRVGLTVGLGLMGVAALAGVTQVTHTLSWNGDSFFDNAGNKISDLLPYLLFNGLPTLGILVVLGVALLGLKTGFPRPTGALTFSVLGVGMVLTGAAGNMVQRITDLELEGTVFGEAAYVYVAYGAIIVALGSVAHWGPKLWGRRLPDPALHLLALGAFGATVISSLPLYVAGFMDTPGDIWFILSAVGHALMVAVLLGFILLALRFFSSGPAAGDDPWDGQTLEWATSSPPPTDNFPVIAQVFSAEPLFDMKPTGGEA
jgi:heme/copper-type cytochrome/quinol oxidase subunit 1